MFDIFLIFAQNIDRWYTLEPPRRGEALLTSIHNLCFGAKIRKIGIPCIPQFCYIKVGFKGVYISRCFPDEYVNTTFDAAVKVLWFTVYTFPFFRGLHLKVI